MCTQWTSPVYLRYCLFPSLPLPFSLYHLPLSFIENTVIDLVQKREGHPGGRVNNEKAMAPITLTLPVTKAFLVWQPSLQDVFFTLTFGHIVVS